MKIWINNKETETAAATVAALSEELSLAPTGVALAVNNQMLPRAEWEHREVREGDKILIIKAVCGG